jgi:hypothetical protein
MRPQAVEVVMRSLTLKRWSLALVLAAALPALAQTSGSSAAATATSKQAEYDCSGMTWTALDNCLKLNADNARAGSRPMDNSPRGATNDCAGMIGAPLETCRKMNGQLGEKQPSAIPATQPMEKS